MYTPVSILKYKVKDWPRYKLTKIRKGLPILEPPSQVFGLKTNLSGAAAFAQPPKNKISLNPASLDNSHRCSCSPGSPYVGVSTPVPQQFSEELLLRPTGAPGVDSAAN